MKNHELAGVFGVAVGLWVACFCNLAPAWGLWLVLAILATASWIVLLIESLKPAPPRPEELIDWSPKTPRGDSSSRS